MRELLMMALIAAPTLVLTPAAVDAQHVVSRQDVAVSYSRRSVNRAFDDGAKVEIYGAPDDDDDAVVEALRLPGWFSPRDFESIEFDADDDEIDRVVLIFAPDIDARRACADPEAADGSGDPQQLLGVYCDGATPESEAWLRSPALDDAETPAFRDAMRLLLRELLPRRNPNRSPKDCKRRTFC